MRSSVAGGVAVAHAADSAALLVMVRAAYVHGLDIMLAVCAVIAIASPPCWRSSSCPAAPRRLPPHPLPQRRPRPRRPRPAQRRPP